MAVPEEQEFSTEIAASPQQCFATVTDFQSYPRWFSAIHSARVLQRYANGLGKRVEYRIDLKLKTIRYVLEYAYEQPQRLTWISVDGDVEAITGSYFFEKLGPRRTRATCHQAVALGFWLPAALRAAIERQALRQSVLEFKAAAENAAAEGAAAPRSHKR